MSAGQGDSATVVTPLAPWLSRAFGQLLHAKPHALLIEGAPGLGQWDLAKALAQAWLCDTPHADRVDGLACGFCASCGLFAAHTHPDLAVLMPEVLALELDWPLPESAQAEINDKKRKPSKEIRADDAQALLAFAQRTPSRRQGKVALIYPPERMNATSANALLKILEEPPGALRFLLASDGSAPLLPTIRSRCQAQRLQWPRLHEGTEWLVGQGVPSAEASALFGASGGKPQAALAMHASALTKPWQALPGQVARGDLSALDSLHGTDPAAWIGTLQKLCHDWLAAATGAGPRFFDRDALSAAQPRAAALLEWSDALRSHARQAHHPLKPELLFELLSAQALAAHRKTDATSQQSQAHGSKLSA